MSSRFLISASRFDLAAFMSLATNYAVPLDSHAGCIATSSRTMFNEDDGAITGASPPTKRLQQANDDADIDNQTASQTPLPNS